MKGHFIGNKENSGNPFASIPSIEKPEELIDIAFRRASRATASDRVRAYRLKKLYAAKVKVAGGYLSSTLERYVHAFPSFDRLHPFHRELADLLVGLDGLKHALGAVGWCAGTIASLQRSHIQRIVRAEDAAVARGEVHSALGRIASTVKQVKVEILSLAKASKELRRIPAIDPSLPTVVVAGCPNVGKSLLVTKLSSARPQVAAYPFTTKSLVVGFMDVNSAIGNPQSAIHRVQVIDTPGLLDRPLERKNPAERQAILALRHLPRVVLFIYDPTGTSGYPMEMQESLHRSLRDVFTGVPFVTIRGKADLPGETDIPMDFDVSAETGEGVEAVRRKLLDSMELRFHVSTTPVVDSMEEE